MIYICKPFLSYFFWFYTFTGVIGAKETFSRMNVGKLPVVSTCMRDQNNHFKCFLTLIYFKNCSSRAQQNVLN